MKDKEECLLADGFTIWQKLYAQFAFIAMGIIGTVGIALVDWRLALPYLFRLMAKLWPLGATKMMQMGLLQVMSACSSGMEVTGTKPVLILME